MTKERMGGKEGRKEKERRKEGGKELSRHFKSRFGFKGSHQAFI